MTVGTGTILGYALIPVAGTIGGAVLAAYRPPGATVRSGVQHVAAGVVFAAVAGELLPEVKRIHEPVQVAIGFAVGIALMLLVRRLTEPPTVAGAEAPEDVRGLVVAIGVDLFIDGLLVGIGFAAGSETGVLIVVALTLEVLFLGMATAAELTQSGATRRRVIGLPTGLAGMLALGAAIGAVALQGLSDPWLEVLLGFGAAALLYLVTEELLVEAHEVPETPATTALFFAGFLVLLLIEMATS